MSDDPDIAKLTLDGKWTLEVFNGYVKTATTSASDSKNNIQRIGIACDSTESFASFFYGSGASLSKNVNGKVQLVSPSFATTHRIDIIGETLFDSTLVKYPEAPKKTMSDVFAACDTIFYASHVHKLVSQDLGIMKDSFLLLPFPKYDVNQESYHNLVSPTASSVFAIPYTAADPDQISFYLQAISEESVNTTYTAYIDSMVKHSHEEVEKKLASLVLSSQKFDIAASLNPSGVYTMISKQIPEFNTNIYERLYNTKKQNIETALNEYLSKFENH